MHIPTVPSPMLRRSLRLAGLAVLLAVGFQVTVESNAGSGDAIVDRALRRGADRLVALQRPDGLWPTELAGLADVPGSGRSARALLAAWKITRDPAHLAAAQRAADAIRPRLGKSEGAVSLGNLIFLAEMGRTTGDSSLTAIAKAAWEGRLNGAERHDGALVGRNLMSRPNPTSWLEGAWRNFLLGRAADEAELARLLGEDEWAESLAIAAAQSWAPKHDYEFWTTATSGMTLALAGAKSATGQRLGELELSLLRQDEIAPGLPWNDTPYDSFVYAYETAGALRGLAATRRPDAVRAAREAAVLVAVRQSSAGGWGAMLSLFDELADAGADDSPAAELAAGETPELDAHVVLALAEVLASTPRAVPQS